MRLTPFRFIGSNLLCGQVERRAIIDRRLSATELDLALEVEFLRRLIGRIDPSIRLQLRKMFPITVKTRRLPLLFIGCQPEPCQIGPDRFDIFFLRPLGIGIIEPQQKCATLFLREHPVVERSADIADMKVARGRRSKAGFYGHTVLNALVIG